MKLLTIIVPTYNMARLLPRCLESLVSSQYAEERIEVLVVNDGSTDDSLLVAQEWRGRYPNIIRIIDKENGNYGSAINAALPHATGTYVKILDSDDWFDTKILDDFLQALDNFTHAGNHPDIVHTVFTSYGRGNVREVIRYNTMGREPYEYGKVYDLDDVLKDGYIRFFFMHALAYRREMITTMGYHQTEGISYTDNEWATIPVYKAQSIAFLNHNLYQYDVCREGQTMDPAVIIHNISQVTVLLDRLLGYYEQHINDTDLTAIRRAWLKQNIENHIRIGYKRHLLDTPRHLFSNERMEEFDGFFWSRCQRSNLSFVLWPENKLLRIDYIKYWHKHHRRWPVWLETINHGVDIVAKKVYVTFFRR